MIEPSKLPDFYFTPAYGELNAAFEGGKLETFVHETPRGSVYHMFILRTIPDEIGGDGSFDISTPYGYGGPVLIDCEDGDRAWLAASYADAFSAFCRERRIVSEFVRFHPLLGNAEDWKPHMDVRFSRHTVAIDLTPDDLFAQFKRNQRRILRHQEDIEVEFDFDMEKLDVFESVYREAMQALGASDYYFFPHGYFEALEACKPHCFLVHARYQGAIVSSRLVFRYGQTLHDHLAGTRPDCYKANGSTTLIGHVAAWGKREGYTRFHLGGGTTCAADDSLLSYKSEFSSGPLYDYHMGQVVHDEAAYRRLCARANEIRGEEASGCFFPGYRAVRPKRPGSEAALVDARKPERRA